VFQDKISSFSSDHHQYYLIIIFPYFSGLEY
jgi:hypothetical protein